MGRPVVEVLELWVYRIHQRLGHRCCRMRDEDGRPTVGSLKGEMSYMFRSEITDTSLCYNCGVCAVTSVMVDF